MKKSITKYERRKARKTVNVCTWGFDVRYSSRDIRILTVDPFSILKYTTIALHLRYMPYLLFERGATYVLPGELPRCPFVQPQIMPHQETVFMSIGFIGQLLDFLAFDPARLADSDMVLRLSLQICLLFGSAFFSSSETALFSLSDVDLEQLRRKRHSRADLVHDLVGQPRRLIISILCGNELINIAAFTRGRIRRAMRFGQTLAAEVMTPIRDVTLMSKHDDITKLSQAAKQNGYRPIPVYEGNIANIVGVVTLTPWDLMEKKIARVAVADMLTPAFYAAPQQSLAQLLPLLRGRPDQSAIVVDEYGSATGMLTLEDILEVVVGEVKIGYHFEVSPHQRRRTFEVIEEGVYLLDARLPISDVNDVIGLNLPTHAYQTIGGMFPAYLKHIPKPGEQIVDSGYRFTVVEATEKAVVTVRAEPET